MTLSTFDTLVFVAQFGLLLAIGFHFRGRLHSGEDFILGRRRLSMPFSAATLAMNSVSVWWIFTLIGLAFAMGVAAIWFALALFGGVLIGGWYLAPRLRALTNLQQRGTFSELLVGDAGLRMRNLLIRSALLIIVATLLFAAVAQLQLVAQLVQELFDFSSTAIIVSISAALCISILFAGVWTTTAVDFWQIVVVIAVCSVLVIALGIGLMRSPDAGANLLRGDWFADQRGLLTVSFTLGIAFIAGDIVGQAPLLSRYMGCSSDAELRRARVYSLIWAAIALTFALLIGWSARSLSDAAVPSTSVFVEVLSRATTPQILTVILLITFGTASAAIGNNLQTVAAHLANDLRRSGTLVSLVHCRLALVLVVVTAALIALNLPLATNQANFDRLAFCWHALGASFGPLLIVRLSGKRVRPGSSLGSIWSGFLLTLVFFLMPDTPGELLERGLPFAAALGIALSGGERRRNPDRADRGERTVHDRLPI